jgi:hypothetical protein
MVATAIPSIEGGNPMILLIRASLLALAMAAGLTPPPAIDLNGHPVD